MATLSKVSALTLTKRRLGVASVAAVLGCAACCAMPLVAAAGIGSGLVTALSAVFRPGYELLVGGGVFVLALSAMAIWSRFTGRGASCKVDGSCAARSTT